MESASKEISLQMTNLFSSSPDDDNTSTSSCESTDVKKIAQSQQRHQSTSSKVTNSKNNSSSAGVTSSSQQKLFASKSAPSSPPATIITAASPEPPAILPCSSTVTASFKQQQPPPLDQLQEEVEQQSRRTSVVSICTPDRTMSPSNLRSPVKQSGRKAIQQQLPSTQQSSSSSMQYMQAPPTRRRGSSNAQVAGSGVSGRRRSREIIPGPIRRASQVLISLTSPDGMSLYGECSRRDSRAVPTITLMSSTFQRLPMKDFGAEVRASMDVDQFLQQAVLLLDVNETSLEGIVDRIVKKVKKYYNGCQLIITVAWSLTLLLLLLPIHYSFTLLLLLFIAFIILPSHSSVSLRTSF